MTTFGFRHFDPFLVAPKGDRLLFSGPLATELLEKNPLFRGVGRALFFFLLGGGGGGGGQLGECIFFSTGGGGGMLGEIIVGGRGG